MLPFCTPISLSARKASEKIGMTTINKLYKNVNMFVVSLEKVFEYSTKEGEMKSWLNIVRNKNWRAVMETKLYIHITFTFFNTKLQVKVF